MKVVAVLCLLVAVAMAGQPRLLTVIGFTDCNYHVKEGTGSVIVKIYRSGLNVINASTVTVTPMTYREFDAMSNFSLPREMQRDTPPDPAECKCNYW